MAIFIMHKNQKRLKKLKKQEGELFKILKKMKKKLGRVVLVDKLGYASTGSILGGSN